MSSCHRNFSLQTKLIRHIRRYKSMYRLAACTAVAAASPRLLDLPWYLAVATGAALYLLTGGLKWTRLAWKTFSRDLTLARLMIKITLLIKSYIRRKYSLGDIFQEKAELHPNKVAIVSADTNACLSFREANNLANKFGNIFYEAGYRKGDTVALLMENCIEYVPIWLGLSKIGVITSLLNFNLRGDSLRHCISVCDCKAIIYSKEMEEPLKDVAALCKMQYFTLDQPKPLIEASVYLKPFINSASDLRPPQSDDVSLLDKVLYIYTSGTTGNPKAAVIRGTRFAFMSVGVGHGINERNNDILYNSLPLYHSNGGIAIAGGMVFFGSTLVIRKKFSASKFFEDCTKHHVTVINYIGETCRYLLAQPVREFDKSHCIRVATGNGLRASIWEEFQTRFSIGKICEFYGATESNANVMNTTGRVGAVGFNSVLFPWVYPIKLIKVDEEGNVVRDSYGLAVDAGTGEIGELVGKVQSHPMRQFDGYVDKSATQKKIVYDIFSKGDHAFLTGDRLIQDEEGYYYFQDRTGDTFRWKGENVSTNEIEGVISKAIQLTDVCVYGVEVPGVEGKAGMAAICDPKRKVDLVKLHEVLSAELPPYAQPVFIRLADEIEKTSTYKFKKNVLREESFDPAAVAKSDNLYYFDGKARRYIEIDADIYAKIKQKEIRF